MAKRFPQGTIRHWSSGDVIKAHDPIHPFSSGWILLKTSPQLEEWGRKCDNMAGHIVSYKEPINGMKFLDHEIDSYKDEQGRQIFQSGDFKAYYGAFGAGRYAFRNVFSKLFMQQAMAKSEYIANALADANKGDREDKLSAEEKREIRKEARKSFKYEQEPFAPKDAEKLYNIIERTQKQIQIGLDFKDPKLKKAYENFKNLVDTIPESYEKYDIKKAVKEDAIKILEENFSDNWGVLESGKELAEKRFGQYVKKYKEQLAEDMRHDLMEKFNISIDDDTETFYGNIFKKVKEDKANGIEDDYGEFKDLLYVRFQDKYNKSLVGNWAIEDLGVLYQFEKLINYLPDGHFLTNSQISTLSNEDYQGGSKSGYAWYSSHEKLINLSSQAKSADAEFMSNSNEFISVVSHEIGHAVSQKLHGSDNYDYRKFAVECGWTYESSELRAGMTATGDQKAIPREGSNAGLKLMTEYSKVAPEEAFAEYYSFYSQYKKDIDKFLETNELSYISKREMIESAFVSSKRQIKDSIPHRIMDDESFSILNQQFQKVSDSLSKETQENGLHELKLVSAWDTRFTNTEQNNWEPSKIRAHKDRSIAGMPPTISYKDKGKDVIIDGVTRTEVARMNKKMFPTISIAKELYFKLRDSGWSDLEVSNYMYTLHRFDDNIAQASKEKIIKGMLYRDHIIPKSIIASNAGILKQMQKIYNSKELAKALRELFEKEDLLIEKATKDTSKLNTFEDEKE